MACTAHASSWRRAHLGRLCPISFSGIGRCEWCPWWTAWFGLARWIRCRPLLLQVQIRSRRRPPGRLPTFRHSFGRCRRNRLNSNGILRRSPRGRRLGHHTACSTSCQSHIRTLWESSASYRNSTASAPWSKVEFADSTVRCHRSHSITSLRRVSAWSKTSTPTCSRTWQSFDAIRHTERRCSPPGGQCCSQYCRTSLTWC